MLGNRAIMRSSAVRDRVLDLVRLYVEVAAVVRATATCRRIKKTLIWAQSYFTLIRQRRGAVVRIDCRQLKRPLSSLNLCRREEEPHLVCGKIASIRHPVWRWRYDNRRIPPLV